MRMSQLIQFFSRECFTRCYHEFKGGFVNLIFFWIAIGVLNLFRFIGLESAPPGFYVDEAAGAAQVMCLKQTGADFFGNSYPLFARGLGGGYYTAPYLYGQMFWTGIFGNSVYSFRAFLAFITTCTAFFLFDWVRRRVSLGAALWVTLFASISPWAFQFSRIAWDPPLAPFFLVFGLWCFDLKKKYGWVLGALAFTLAGYSYPPCRIQAVVLLFFLPGMKWRKKFEVFGVFLVANIPMFYQAWTDPGFTARGKMLALTSNYSMNPYRDSNLFGLLGGFIVQFFAHFSPDFLFLHGDHNLRHSPQTVGVLSDPEGLALITGAIYWLVSFVKNKKAVLQPLFVFAIIGIASGIAPAALTWESVPHALRAIGAWPFFVLLSGLTADLLFRKLGSWSFTWKRILQNAFLVGCFGFTAFYFYDFFYAYPDRAENWFRADDSPLGSAYSKMTELNVFCSDIRK